MRRGTANAVVDTVPGILVVPSFVPALVLVFVLPSGGGRGGTFLPVERSTRATLHDDTGLLFIALLVVHLALRCRYLRHLDRHLPGPGSTTDA